MAKLSRKQLQRQQRLQELNEALDTVEQSMEDLAWRSVARHAVTALEGRAFTVEEDREVDQDATTWYCLGEDRDALRAERASV